MNNWVKEKRKCWDCKHFQMNAKSVAWGKCDNSDAQRFNKGGTPGTTACEKFEGII